MHTNQGEGLFTSALLRSTVGVKSLARIRFPSKDMILDYYNDLFDLQKGDMVFVDGKLEGVRGIVIDVIYNFKIKPSQYHRVIALVNTEVHGTFQILGSHFVTFDRAALPKEQLLTWFKAPEEEEYVTGEGDSQSFPLSDLSGFEIKPQVVARGHEYYVENRVRYLCLDGTKGYAIVEGGEAYEVEFTYQEGQISHMTCSCPYHNAHCKHEFAMLLQFRDILDLIEEHHREEYQNTSYFAAISKGTLLDFTVLSKESGSITI